MLCYKWCALYNWMNCRRLKLLSLFQSSSISSLWSLLVLKSKNALQFLLNTYSCILKNNMTFSRLSFYWKKLLKVYTTNVISSLITTVNLEFVLRVLPSGLYANNYADSVCSHENFFNISLVWPCITLSDSALLNNDLYRLYPLCFLQVILLNKRREVYRYKWWIQKVVYSQPTPGSFRMKSESLVSI
jgi:hypothetical protein